MRGSTEAFLGPRLRINSAGNRTTSSVSPGNTIGLIMHRNQVTRLRRKAVISRHDADGAPALVPAASRLIGTLQPE
jgi:hypothetical protein